MADHKNLSISVQNVGPIVRGQVELRPLTLLIGPNNSGKSYLALLIYALTRAITGAPLYRSSAGYDVGSSLYDPELFNKYREDMQDYLAAVQRTRTDPLLSGAPSRVQQAFQDAIESHIADVRGECVRSVRNYFNIASFSELAHAPNGGSGTSVSLSVGQTSPPFLEITQGVGAMKEEITITGPSLTGYRIPLKTVSRVGSEPPPFELLQIAAGDIFQTWGQEHGVPESCAFYLPAARSGVLQGWQMVASVAVQTVGRFAGRGRIAVPVISEVARDFMQILLGLTAQRPRETGDSMRAALSALEEDIFRGNVSMKTSGPTDAQLLYRSGAGSIPIERASSMVAELAPLDLWIKHVVEPGDLLIIDEPEAHLHPENQRKIARVLVRLIRAGVRVVCPTHSSLILHQLSNLLLASNLPPDERSALGYAGADILNKEDIGVYLFDCQTDGTVVREVPIDEEFGISEEDFLPVLEAIGDETYRISAAREEGSSEAGE